MKKISFDVEDADFEDFRKICKREGKKREDYLRAAVKAIVRQKKAEKPKLSRKEAEIKYRELE